MSKADNLHHFRQMQDGTNGRDDPSVCLHDETAASREENNPAARQAFPHGVICA
ncbi:MAG: hypothetical protein AB9919_12125 [Geobacteraceae bacterium]